MFILARWLYCGVLILLLHIHCPAAFELGYHSTCPSYNSFRSGSDFYSNHENHRLVLSTAVGTLFGQPELSRNHCRLLFLKDNLGIGISSGNLSLSKLYREQSIGGLIALRLRPSLYLLLSGRRFEQQIRNYPTLTGYGAGLGWQVAVNRQLVWHSFFDNLGCWLDSEMQGNIPKTIHTGLTLTSNQQHRVVVNWSHDRDYQGRLVFNYDRKLSGWCRIAAGYRTAPAQLLGVISLNLKWINIEYQVTSHQHLPLSHTAGLSLSWPGQRSKHGSN